MDELRPDRYVITYLHSFDGHSLNDCEGDPCTYQMLWRENFSDETSKDFSTTITSALLYELPVDYSVLAFKDAIDLTEKRSNGENIFFQANITAVIPSVITGKAGQLPIM